MSRVAVVVLAAGGSSRMGRPKQLLPVGGQSLLRRAVETAVECGPTVVVLGANAERLRTELDGLDVGLVVNPDWERGPGTSIAAGVAVLEESADSVVFLLADQPAVTADHVRRLIDVWQASRLPMAASEYGGSVGVPALFAREMFPALMALDPTAGAKQVLIKHRERVAVVPFPDGAIDLDTPADYERWLDAKPQAARILTEASHDLGQ